MKAFEKKVVHSILVEPATVQKLREVAAGTDRGIGQTIDMLVAEAWERMQHEQNQK